MFWPTIVIAAALMLALFAWLEISESTRGKVDRVTVCPHTGRTVQVTLEDDFFDPQHYHEVLACSAFAPAWGPVTCDRACLRQSRHELDKRRVA